MSELKLKIYGPDGGLVEEAHGYDDTDAGMFEAQRDADFEVDRNCASQVEILAGAKILRTVR